MYTLLLPVDETEARVQAQLDAILSRPGVPDEIAVHVLYVRKELEFADSEIQIGEIKFDYEDVDQLPDTVSTALESLRDAGVDTRVHSATGNPPPAILDVAEQVGADELVLGSRKQSPVGKVIFGSVTQAVLLDSDRPVTVVSGVGN
ncbi:UspA domain protein (plasmid) [Natrialba magadii ATCC 43099]|uniref:UspA domain protein n=1 Tax=Natrialba magadii (strain ATCC 43099 / DSM 3394 / CCM 3739 / CIP 104546 / IAM 13178 / JCM 8861 / NBRC 102185 / NCIMB 2190 / MS3) TaxID=547559 RepID=D3T0R9_NATMM|nr:universal stress protein [Natrialba magadii]ADD07178.1 UspA domain protein [Natrialba magadii ATCC 43099]ELY34582.1 UspA domain-containing protein [Natrialba magadii ATCC 43099]